MADIDPWALELIVVRGSHDGRARNALSRDGVAGRLLQLRRGAWVERTAFESLDREGRHLVRMRALAATTDGPVVFSHFSAAVVLGLPVLEHRLDRVHITVSAQASRTRTGTAAHVLPLSKAEVVEVRGLLVTCPGRTVVDVAGAAPFEEGVVTADAAMRAGFRREHLTAWLEHVRPRRAVHRIADVLAFAHPGAESAAESLSRTSLLHLGIEPPELQHRVVLLDGSAVFLDMHFRSRRAGGEVDGAKKLLDPALSKDARATLWREKRREDALRLMLDGLARWGWTESRDPARLAPVLAAIGVVPASPRAVLQDYADAARDARPRSGTALLYG